MLAFHPSEELLISLAEDNTIRLWDLESGRELALDTLDRLPQALAISPDGRWVAAGGLDIRVRLWDPATLRELPSIGPLPSSVWSLAFSPDSRRLGFSLVDRVVVVDVGIRESGNPSRFPSCS